MNNIGFRVFMSIQRLPREVIDSFKELSTPNLADCMNRFYAMNPSVRNYGKPGIKLVGSALTVKAAPGDNIMIHKAIDIAEEGDVIVIATGGDIRHSMLGEIMCRLAARKGCEASFLMVPFAMYTQFVKWAFLSLRLVAHPEDHTKTVRERSMSLYAAGVLS